MIQYPRMRQPRLRNRRQRLTLLTGLDDELIAPVGRESHLSAAFRSCTSRGLVGIGLPSGADTNTRSRPPCPQVHPQVFSCSTSTGGMPSGMTSVWTGSLAHPATSMSAMMILARHVGFPPFRIGNNNGSHDARCDRPRPARGAGRSTSDSSLPIAPSSLVRSASKAARPSSTSRVVIAPGRRHVREVGRASPAPLRFPRASPAGRPARDCGRHRGCLGHGVDVSDPISSST
jgi:hypothetical protein